MLEATSIGTEKGRSAEKDGCIHLGLLWGPPTCSIVFASTYVKSESKVCQSEY